MAIVYLQINKNVLFNKCKRKIVAADTIIAITNKNKGEIIMATVTLVCCLNV